MTKEQQLRRAADIAVEQCLAVQKNETVLVVCDEPCRTIGRALWEAAVCAGSDAVYTEIISRNEHGEEPPACVSAAMLQADVIFAPTSKSLTHTEARRAASEAGARVATLPGITEEVMARALVADYEGIRERTEKLAARIRGRSTVRISTPAGTDITFSIAGREVMCDTGILKEPGVTNLPAGEAFLAPVEGTGNGVVMIDGSIARSGVLDAPIRVEVVDGYATDITGHPYAAELSRSMDAAGPEARNLAELGIGTNDAAQLVGIVLEDEKILGTVHLAFGDNRSMGGRVRAPFHQDGILLKPSVWIDGEQLMSDGTLLLV